MLNALLIRTLTLLLVKASLKVFLNIDIFFLFRSSVFGLEPMYSKVNSGYKTFLYDQPFYFKYNDGVIPQLKVAYETWGELNEAKDNVVLLLTGLSASSHAKSHLVSLRHI